MYTDRRTFITAALGTAFLAGCANDPDLAGPVGGSTAPTTGLTTGPTSTVPAATLATATTIAPTTVASMAPVAPLPSSERWWLDKNFAPVVGDLDATDLRVSGQLPAALSGTWVRNGSNPAGESAHWFLGNGMVHGLRLRDGQAEWYRRTAIQTPYLLDPENAGIPGGAVSYSNVSSVFHGGRLLSLGEIGFPYELDADDLSTVGAHDFEGQLTTNMTAHPKIDAQTGEMHFFGYNFAEPYLTYLVADAAGQLQRTVPITLPAPSMVHDFAITEQSVLFLDLAVVFTAAEPGLPYLFDRGHQCRIGVLDRAATFDTTRWFDIEPCFVFHTINAHQDGSIITFDVIRYDELKAGEIKHALRVTIKNSRKAYVAPATHYASRKTDPNLPRMGERLRLKASVDTSRFSPEVKIIAAALKKYGMLVADNGIDWALSSAPDERIPTLHDDLRKIKGSMFEVVEMPK